MLRFGSLAHLHRMRVEGAKKAPLAFEQQRGDSGLGHMATRATQARARMRVLAAWALVRASMRMQHILNTLISPWWCVGS